jgi:hypothetical protein
MNPRAAEFISLVRHPIKFRWFLLSRLPAAFFSGVRVKEIDEQHCLATVPFTWLTKNPFRSTYFASLSMAAEMTTGVLGLMQIYKREPSVSMLVVKVDSSYYKKATGRTKFVCTDGALFEKAVEESILTGEPKTITAHSSGVNESGETVADFFVTWTFKPRKQPTS